MAANTAAVLGGPGPLPTSAPKSRGRTGLQSYTVAFRDQGGKSGIIGQQTGLCRTKGWGRNGYPSLDPVFTTSVQTQEWR